MKKIPPIKSVMTAFPHSIELGQPLGRALEMMTEHGIRHLPVVKNDLLVGLLTERQVRLALRPDGAGKSVRVRDVATDAIYVVELSEPLDVVLLEMAKRRVNAALVVKEGRLVGIFTEIDALRCFGEMLRTLFPRGHKDDAA